MQEVTQISANSSAMQTGITAPTGISDRSTGMSTGSAPNSFTQQNANQVNLNSF